MTDTTVRPTKKQRELLAFIGDFIREHGYSPSYREIMAGLDYTSVATVSLHINNLIRRGHLRKRDRSARSLEVVAERAEPEPDLADKLRTLLRSDLLDTDMAALQRAMELLGYHQLADECATARLKDGDVPASAD